MRWRSVSGIRALLATAMLLQVAGCGFHLRGDVQYTFKTLFLNAPADNTITPELRRAIESGGRVQIAATPQAAEVVVDVANVTDEKQVLSLSGGGRVREYLLIKRATLAVHDASGKDWLPSATVQVRRSYTFSETEVLARESQEQHLLQEMQSDLVAQILRRLQAAKPPVG